MAGVALPAPGDDHGRVRRRGTHCCSGRRRHRCYRLVPRLDVEHLGQDPGYRRPHPVRILVVIPRGARPRRVRLRIKRAIVGCEEAREAISARLDGEQSPFPVGPLDAHVVLCEACRDFEAAALAIGRRLSLRASRPVPDDLVETLVALMGPPQRPILVPLGRRRPGTGSGFGYGPTVRWAAAMLPAVVAAAAFSFGVGSHPRLVPTRPPSPCTIGLIARHIPPAG